MKVIQTMLTTSIAIRKNKKFTTAVIGCFLRLPLTKHNLAYASLLARIQMNSSLSYPSLALQQKRLAELYDLQLEIMPQVFGKEILLTYYANFVEPIEILDPHYTYEEILNVIAQIVNQPNFAEPLVEYAKRQLAEEYQELIEQPSNYALEQFFKLWYQDQPDYAETFIGSLDEIKAATSTTMMHYWRNLANVPMQILGMTRDNNLVSKLAQAMFQQTGLTKSFQTVSLTIPAKRKLIEKEDDQGNVQAQLLMGFGLEQSIDYRGQVMGILLSQYLAGDQSSKLFTQIREQLGAAYNVEASCFANNSLFLVSAGLDPSKIAAARKIILSEMGKLVQGEVEDDLFKKAKKAILRNMKIGLDGQNWQMGQMLRDELFSGYLDFDRENAIRRATPKQLVAFVQNLFFNESYVLK